MVAKKVSLHLSIPSHCKATLVFLSVLIQLPQYCKPTYSCCQAPFLLELRSKSTLSCADTKGIIEVIRLPGHPYLGYHISWVMGPKGMFQLTFLEPLGFHLSNADAGIRSGMSWQALPTDTLHGLTRFMLAWIDSHLLTTESLRIKSST